MVLKRFVMFDSLFVYKYLC